jgi:hypothetical protein
VVRKGGQDREGAINLIYVVFLFLETNYIWAEGIPFSAVGVTYQG